MIYASEEIGFDSEVVINASEEMGSTSEVTIYTSKVMGFAKEGRAFTSEATRHGIAIGGTVSYTITLLLFLNKLIRLRSAVLMGY